MNFIDLHCDTFWKPPESEEKVSLYKNDFCVDIEKLKKAQSMAQFFACFIYTQKEVRSAERYMGAFEYALRMIDCAKNTFAEHTEHITLATHYDSLIENWKAGKISAFLTIEEGGILEGDMKRLEILYNKGVRLMTLLWNYENCLGSPNSCDEKVMNKGLTPFGIEVVERMNELGMIVDVSHLSDGGFWDVIKYSKKPFVASHSNARKLCNHPRNLSDEMIRALAGKGGVAGLNLYPYFINDNARATAEDIADHALHMFQVGGEDFVAIGTDYDGFDEGELELTDIGQMHILYDTIQRRGLSQRQMDKMWSGNAIRVLKETL